MISLIPIGQLIWRLITRGEQALFNLEIKKKSGLSINPDIHHSKVPSSELKTLEWNILNPDRWINLEINNKRRTSIFNLEIKKKSGSSINLDIHHSKFPISVLSVFKSIMCKQIIKKIKIFSWFILFWKFWKFNLFWIVEYFQIMDCIKSWFQLFRKWFVF